MRTTYLDRLRVFRSQDFDSAKGCYGKGRELERYHVDDVKGNGRKVDGQASWMLSCTKRRQLFTAHSFDLEGGILELFYGSST